MPLTGGPEQRLRDIQRRFRAISARLDRAVKLRRWYRLGKIAALAALVAFALCWVLLSLSPWPPMLTLRHIAVLPVQLASLPRERESPAIGSGTMQTMMESPANHCRVGGNANHPKAGAHPRCLSA
jgi:hypothetical protein